MRSNIYHTCHIQKRKWCKFGIAYNRLWRLELQECGWLITSRQKLQLHKTKKTREKYHCKLQQTCPTATAAYIFPCWHTFRCLVYATYTVYNLSFTLQTVLWSAWTMRLIRNYIAMSELRQKHACADNIWLRIMCNAQDNGMTHFLFFMLLPHHVQLSAIM